MRVSVVDKTRAIVLVLQRGNDPRRLRLLAFCLVFRLLPSADTRHKGETRAVRRPHGVGYAVAEISEPHGLTTIGRHDIQLRFLLRHPLRDEGQPRAVWRPARCRIAFGASGEAARFITCRVYHPDVGQILVLVFGKHGDDKGHPSPLRRELRVTDKPNTRNILRRHGAPTGYGHSTPPSEHGDVAIGRNDATVPVVFPAYTRACCRLSSLICDAPHPSMLTRQCQTGSTC